MSELFEMTAVGLRDALRAGEVTPGEVVEHYVGRIEMLNPQLGAFSCVTADAARQRAAGLLADGLPTDGEAVLWGMLVGDKDLWDRAGVASGYGSRAFSGDHRWVPQVSTDIVDMLDGQGVISLGRTTAPEFGFPAYTEPMAGPIARNPWDRTRTAGGSSGGAAVAVAAGMLPFAPGSDGGGSIRIPAAACGLVGLKPTRGLVVADYSLAGLVVNGPIARTVADTALLLAGMAGGDHPTAVLASAAPLRVAVSTFSGWDGFYDMTPAPEALAALEAGVNALAAVGHDIVDDGAPIPWEPDPTYAPAFRTVWLAGAAALPIESGPRPARRPARGWPEAGQDFGDRDPRFDLLEPLTQWLITEGRRVTARQLAEALSALADFEKRTVARLNPYDLVILPALGMVPPPLGWFDSHDPERNFEQQCQFTPYTSAFNASGLPAITLPTRWTEPTVTAPAGMPMGVQLVGRPGSEETLLSVAAQMEAVIDRPAWPMPDVSSRREVNGR
ncbi:MAG: amidase [Cellulomonadaceae bacterium]|nr:amidase [Cellulomonadaceae bacterium]